MGSQVGDLWSTESREARGAACAAVPRVTSCERRALGDRRLVRSPRVCLPGRSVQEVGMVRA